MLVAVDWTNVLDTLIITVPAIIAALYAGKIHRAIRTPSGRAIGKQVESALHTGIANNMWLSTQGKTQEHPAADVIQAATEEGPKVPAAQ